VSEPTAEDLGEALARTVSALELVHLEALEPRDREAFEAALLHAKAALAEYRRAMRSGEQFAQED
jgi:hypothetical protein